MASTRQRQRYKITDDLLTLLEGQLQQLRDDVKNNPNHVPSVAMPIRFIEAAISVPQKVIREWLRESTAPRAREEYLQFASLFLAFVSLFASRYERNIQTIANDTTNRSSLAANLKLREWLDAEELSLGERSDGAVGNIPADLANELTEDEYQILLAREDEDQRRSEQDQVLLDRLRARKAQRRIAEQAELADVE